MREDESKTVIAGIVVDHVGKSFAKAWVGCVNDRGSVNCRIRFQPSVERPTYTSFMPSIPESLRIDKLVLALLGERALSQNTPCNAVTFIIEGDGMIRCDYGFRDVVKTGWAPIFDQWDRDYLAGLKPEPVKGKPWES